MLNLHNTNIRKIYFDGILRAACRPLEMQAARSIILRLSYFRANGFSKVLGNSTSSIFASRLEIFRLLRLPRNAAMRMQILLSALHLVDIAR